jgi:hypothetical protein
VRRPTRIAVRARLLTASDLMENRFLRRSARSMCFTAYSLPSVMLFAR